MALVLTQDEVMLVDAAKGLLGREAPLKAFRALRDSGDPLSYDPALLQRLAASGFVAPNVAEADGGIGLGASAAGLIMEQAGHVLAAAPLLSAAMASYLIGKVANVEQRSRLLPEVIAGAMTIAVALDEAARHDPGVLTTTATTSGEGWLLSGSKTAVIDGFGARGWLVSARCEGAAALFLVERDAPGLTIDKVSAVDSRNYARLFLEGTPAMRLGEADAGEAIAAALDLGRALLTAELLGICDRLYVMNEGCFVDEMPASEASQEKIMASIMRQYGTAA